MELSTGLLRQEARLDQAVRELLPPRENNGKGGSSMRLVNQPFVADYESLVGKADAALPHFKARVFLLRTNNVSFIG